jgi:hypothetical protein
MLATLLLTALTAAPAVQKDPPAKVEIFAQEDFYKKEEAKEQEYTGTITRIKPSATGGGAMRSPYRVTIITYVEVTKTVIKDGKKVQVTEKVPRSEFRDLYVAGKGELIEPFLDKPVKIVGKAVTVEMGKQKLSELWPATIELADAKKDAKDPPPPVKDKLPPAKEPPPAKDLPPAKLKVPPGPVQLPPTKKDVDASPQKEQKDPPAKLDLFEKEDWYKNQKGEALEFIGVLGKVEMKKGTVGFGRFNPYRLEFEVTVKVLVKEIVGDKAVVREVPEKRKEIREVYVGGKQDILDPYVGKTVKLVGKAVDMEVDGKLHREIWPARLEVMADPPKSKEPPRDEECCQDDKETPLKIHAKARWSYVSAAPDSDKKGVQLVFRSAAELVAATPFKNLDAEQKIVEKKATEELAKQFKVDTIDWTKQMVVVVSGGVKGTGGWKIDILSVVTPGKGATVTWQLDPPKGVATQAFTHPSVMVLVDRVDGEVRFSNSAGKVEKK